MSKEKSKTNFTGKETEKLREKVMSKIDMANEPKDDEIHDIIDEVIRGSPGYAYVSVNERCRVHREIYDSIRGLGALDVLLEDDDITEIMVNGAESIYIEKEGRLQKVEDKFSSEERLGEVIQQIVGRTNRRVNESSPIVDTRLEDGSRVNVVLPPVAIDGSALTIRKFKKDGMHMEEMVRMGSISGIVADFLKSLVRAGYNIFVSGGTGSGKTTFLNAMSEFIPQTERIITIEDSAELCFGNACNIIRMEARTANTEGENEITIRDLIKTSLRMRPDRVIVGEVRGGEALDMLQAMNTGHDGSMSTGHANSPRDMLSRLETMVLTGIEMPLDAIRAQIASGIDIIVHLGRLRDGSRKVLEIDEVLGYMAGEIKLEQLYIFKETGEKENIVEGKLEWTGKSLVHTGKLVARGVPYPKMD